MKPIFKYLRPYKKQLIAGPFFKLLEAVGELMLPLIMARLVNLADKGAAAALIWRQAGTMLTIAVFGLCSALLCQYYASVAAQGYGTALRNALLAKITSLDAATLDSFGRASLVNRVTNDTAKLDGAVAMLIRLVVRAPFLCVGAAIMSVMISPRLSVIIIVLTVIFIAVLWLLMFRTLPLSMKVRRKLDSMLLIIRENLSGMRVVRAFGRGAKQTEKFADTAAEHTSGSETIGMLGAVLNPVTNFLMNIAIALLVWFASGSVPAGEMTKGDMVAFISYVTTIMLQMIIIARLVIQYTNAYASARRVGEVLSAAPLITDSDTAADVNFSKKNKGRHTAVEFRGVNFSYPSSKEQSLSGVSFSLRAGGSLGIIGATGSGKTTLASLMMREYDVSSGSVLIFGSDVRSLRLKSLRSVFGFVPQKAVLLSGSVRGNIRNGNPDCSEEEIISSAKAAQADDFIKKLSGGYDFYIEKGGGNLSGGQRQRVTIARALVRKPKILLLDDSTSALDANTDAALRAELRRLGQEFSMSTIIISQRISAVKHCDSILVLEEGAAVGKGSHEQLLSECEEYREIYESQEG
ncbi:MAG: ABC transporter ATP-binding protein/permease [Oscillospiraceae bacterium]|jgi:ATP-binding cassette subfamily B protein|nr:ABC transporter ATP-binding protein/permease [Oscillospiraceae bacterium]